MAKATRKEGKGVKAETPAGGVEMRGQMGPEDPLEPFSNRLPRSLHRRLKVYAAQSGRSIGEILREALEGYLGGQPR